MSGGRRFVYANKLSNRDNKKLQWNKQAARFGSQKFQKYQYSSKFIIKKQHECNPFQQESIPISNLKNVYTLKVISAKKR